MVLKSGGGGSLNKSCCSRRQHTATTDLPYIIQTNGVPIHMYTDDYDDNILKQLKILAESPVPTDYVAAMPDVHLGRGVTIGCVFASESYVCPNAVGVDIGCGVAAIPIDGLFKDDLSFDQKNQMQQMMKDRIPTGFNQHRTTLRGTRKLIDKITSELQPSEFIENQLLLPRVTDQLGTLGGGNHFLELVYAVETSQVWVMLHSGSRNIGNRVAMHYDQVAKMRLEKQGINTRYLNGINYMPIESRDGRDYLRDMEWCQQYAFHNRRVMKEIMLRIVEEITGKEGNTANTINVHHNYCTCEDCGNGRKLWVTRKGATSAKPGEMGLIPGSMGTGSFVTRGKGNPMSWSSSAHGAGRRMSRTKAIENISQEAFESSMKGIVCDTHPNLKDEAPQAYKNLSVVIEQSESLTDVVYQLLPLVNVKGFNNSKTQKRCFSKKRKKAKWT